MLRIVNVEDTNKEEEVKIKDESKQIQEQLPVTSPEVGDITPGTNPAPEKALSTPDVPEENSKDMFKIAWDYLSNHDKVDDNAIHGLAEEHGLDKHEFEEVIYGILTSFLSKGKAKEKGVTEDKVDPEQLKMGIEVEKEHTDNETMAKRIALDHLSEIPDYYTRLDKMEKEAVGQSTIAPETSTIPETK